LRAILLFVALATFGYGYLFLFEPGVIGWFFDIEGYPDVAHVHLSMSVGVLLLVFAIGALLAMFRPLKSGCMITMLILLHFAIFLFDVVLLAIGSVIPMWFLLPEMGYTLLVSILLIRFFPVRDNSVELSESAGQLVRAFKKQVKKEQKHEPASPLPPPPETTL
jgi:hypothetical protein